MTTNRNTLSQIQKISVFAMILVALMLSAFSSPVAAQDATPTDLGNIVVDGTHPWPATNPFSAAKAAEVTKCQSTIGTYDADGTSRFYDLSQTDGYATMVKACLTGVIWFKDFAPTGTKFENAAAPAVSATVTPTPNAAISSPTICNTLSTRDERLDCATKLYFNAVNSGGSKLDGVKAMLTSMGVTWNQLTISDPFQPDAVVKANGPQIWGVLVVASNVMVSGNTVLVTDQPSRIKNAGWKFIDTRYATPVIHAGNAESSDQMVEIAIHLDGSDWSEIVSAMGAAPAAPTATATPSATTMPGATATPTGSVAKAAAQGLIAQIIALLQQLSDLFK